MVNTSEPLINVVSENKPKIADRLEPKRHEARTRKHGFLCVNDKLPVDSKYLTQQYFTVGTC